VSLRPAVSELLSQLKGEDLLPPDREQRAAKVLGRVDAPLPWYVRALAGLGGWVAALFALGFVEFIHPSDDALTVLGFGALGVAVLLRRNFDKPFSNQLAIALALAGEAAALWGLGGHLGKPALAIAALGIELSLIALYPDALMRFLSTCCAFVAVLHYQWLLDGGTDYLWSNRQPFLDLTWPAALALLGSFTLLWLRPKLELTKVRDVVLPVAYGLSVCALMSIIEGLERPWNDAYFGPHAEWVFAVVGGGFVLVMLREAKSKWRESALAIGGTVVLALLFHNPGILAAAALIGAGVWRREVKLIALASAALLWFGSAFYYHLSLSLLAKSGAMIGAGAMFLALWFYLDRLGGKVTHEEAARA
jgi:hypothetical protein